MILLLQNAVFALAFLAVLFLIGTLLLRVAGWKQSVCGAVAWGFIAVLGVFHMIAYPLYLASASFSALVWICTPVLLALLAASVVVAVRQKLWRAVLEEESRLWAGVRQTPLPFVVLGLMALLLLYYGVFYYSNASDDSYYLPRAMEVIEQNTLGVSHSFAWFGREIDSIPSSTDASTLEFFKAYLSYVSGIQVTALCRNGLEIALLVISLCSVWTFVDTFTGERENALFIRQYAMIVWIAMLMLDLNFHTNAYWITHFLWQGKSMLPGMMFPMLFAACGNIMGHIESFKYREWLPVLLTLLAGVSATIVGIFLMPILFFLIGLAYMILTKFRRFVRIALCAVVSVLPVVVMIVISYLQIVSVNTHYLEQEQNDASWIKWMVYSTNKFVIVLFLICAVYVAIKGSRVERALFVVMPALLLLTFLNPLLRNFVSTYITTPSVYWRLFWLVPSLLLPTYVIPSVLLRRQTPGQVQRQLIAACVTVCVLCGFEWARNGASAARKIVFPIERVSVSRENPYRITGEALAVADAILADWDGDERPMLLFYDAEYRINEIRQYTQQINLACGFRKNQVVFQQDLVPGTQVTENDFYNAYQTIEDGAYFHDMLTRLGIDYVCFYEEPACQDPQACGFTPLYEGKRTLWRVDAP